jgi:hypothetical protein
VLRLTPGLTQRELAPDRRLRRVVPLRSTFSARSVSASRSNNSIATLTLRKLCLLVLLEDSHDGKRNRTTLDTVYMDS